MAAQHDLGSTRAPQLRFFLSERPGEAEHDRSAAVAVCPQRGERLPTSACVALVEQHDIEEFEGQRCRVRKIADSRNFEPDPGVGGGQPLERSDPQHAVGGSTG